ncbi:ATP-dependent DNA ligase [Rathayibacter caricis DSM 15933]|uniref:ATP-dependent DNA ligase n=1 Tax=Rathayibacter caricis DSM 15933 TaxID=1328867 RepID=A0A2T4UPN1_9MICO|nr:MULTISPECIES: ATP-dependent DNA ligase [Rathayibacter]PTL71490.1 ATP-dependent DNA ligase [Rathayibacter caricis DSM 15933]
MGRLVYDSRLDVHFDDRVLAHLQAVIGIRLRRGESFYLSWKDLPNVGNGRSSIWLDPRIALCFRYGSGPAVVIDGDRVRRWVADSYSPGGLRVTEDPV